MVKTARTIMITIKVPRFVAIKDEEIVEAKTTTIPILVPTSNGLATPTMVVRTARFP